MALITCPDCGGSVSDAAPACIHCAARWPRRRLRAPWDRRRPRLRYAAPPPAGDPMARRAAERDERAAAARRIAIVTYVLNFLAFLYFVPGIVALVVAYVKRGDARGTWVESHFDWQIATFWTGLWWVIGTVVVGTAAAIVLDSAALVTIVLYPVAFAILIWYIYRLVRGALALNDEKPIS